MLALAGVYTLIIGAEMPSTTCEGVQAGLAWRNYRAGLRQTRHLPAPLFDLNQALPYAVAMGSAKLLDGHLKGASDRGFAPVWFVRNPTQTHAPASFYPNWIGLHSSLGPSTSSTGPSTAVSAGGASAGGSF